MLYVIIRGLTVLLFKLFFRLQAFNRENIPLTGGFILASNHRSYLDPPALGAASPRMLSYLAKKELFRNPLFGSFIRGLHAFPLRTDSGDMQALRWAVKELKAGNGVVIFPEGRRTAEGESVRPSKGVGFLALKTGAPIVPVFIDGSEKAMPVHSKFIYPKKIKIYFGRPIAAAEINLSPDKQAYQKIADKVMQKIQTLKERGD